jgi:hypothetical protein
MRYLLTCLVLGAGSGLLGIATLPAQSIADHPDISGYWTLRYDSISPSLATLTPQASSADKRKQIEHDQLAIRWCDQLGTPALMADRQPLDIEQSPKAVSILAHTPSSVRYIFTDGRSHANKDDFDPTTNGNSIGHWEGKTLVADTIYFNDRGVTMLPGGGTRTADSHLVEHYTLSDDGQRLLVTFTWTDPKVFAKPHTYSYTYYKTQYVGEPRIDYCNSRDQERAKFLLPGSDASATKAPTGPAR